MFAKLDVLLYLFSTHVNKFKYILCIIVDHFIKGTHSTSDVMEYDERIDDVILKILCTRDELAILDSSRMFDFIFKKERLNRGLKLSFFQHSTQKY